MSKTHQEPSTNIASPLIRGGKIAQVLNMSFRLAVAGGDALRNSDLVKKIADIAPKPESAVEAVGYAALFSTNNTLEFLKTRRQMGLDDTYTKSLEQVVTEKGKPLYAPALQLANRLTYRVVFTAIAAKADIELGPLQLATLDTALSLPNENHRMAVALDKNTPCLLKWAKQVPLQESYRGAGIMFGRQFAQWKLIYSIRGWLKENTPLDHNDSTLVAVAAASTITMPLDVARNVAQDPRNAEVSFVDKVKKTGETFRGGNAFRGGGARVGAQTIASLLSVKAMEWSNRVYNEHVQGVSGRSH